MIKLTSLLKESSISSLLDRKLNQLTPSEFKAVRDIADRLIKSNGYDGAEHLLLTRLDSEKDKKQRELLKAAIYLIRKWELQ